MHSSVLPRNISRSDHFQIIQIKPCALKVNIHCHGCKEKVKKILRKIEGVYSVDVDAEQQKVKVYGNVDSTTLINKLVKSGKHAELWPSIDQEIPSFINGENYQNQIQNLITSLNAPKSQPLLTPGYPRGLEDQVSFERYLKESMNMENNHEHIGWDDRSVIGDNNTSGFIDLEGSQLAGFGGSFNGELPSYHDQHHSSLPMNMNMHHAPPINMNMHGSMQNVMVHDNMHMRHALPMFRPAQYY